jgi:hypothetical protein
VSTEANKEIIRKLNGIAALSFLANSTNEKVKQQATRALMNLGHTL